MRVLILSLFMCCTAVYGNIQWSAGQKICVKGKGKSPGYWEMPKTGKLKAVKLVHEGTIDESFVTCIKRNYPKTKTYWGCKDLVGIMVTDMENVSLFPTPGRDIYGFYKLPGRTAMSDSLVMGNIFGADPMTVNQGDWVKIWYGQDLFTESDQQEKELKDQTGTTCMMAYAYISA